MHELRLVAVSEDGTYLVLASAGRGTRFTLPVDDRLRAAVRGQFSRLGQYEIEVENPLRPKEIQARIRSGETAEAISEISGIPIERVRWFEGPVLQEREYIAQQAQRATVRAHGGAAPGASLEDLVTKRIGAHQLETGDAEWDSWKREDRSWQLKLVFLHRGEERVAHWLYEPRHNSVVPADEEAARFSSPEPDHLTSPGANVTPFVPRRGEATMDLPRMDAQSAAERRPDHIAPRRRSHEAPQGESPRPAPVARPEADRFGDPGRDGRRQPFDTPHFDPADRHPAQGRPVEYLPSEPRFMEDDRDRDRHYDHRPVERERYTEPPAERSFEAPRAEPEGTRRRSPEPEPRRAHDPADPAAHAEPAVEEWTRRPEHHSEHRATPEWPLGTRPAGPTEPEAVPPAEPPAQQRPPARRRRATIDLNDTGTPRRATEPPPSAPVPAAPNSGSDHAAPKRKGRGRRASVPSWDEIMFGSKKDD